MTKLFIGTPVASHVHAATRLAIDTVRAALLLEGIETVTYQEPRGSLPLAHSLIASRFLASDASHLLIVHADVAGFTPADVLRMLHSGKDLIGAPLPGRSFDPERIARALSAGVPPEDAWRHAAPQLWFPKESPRFDDGCLEVAAMSTGFLMMTRAALDAAAKGARHIAWESERFVHVFEEDVEEYSRQLMSEDTAFCARAQANGIPCWADTRASLVHFGNTAFYTLPLERVLVPRTNALRSIPMIVRSPFVCPTTCEEEARVIWGGAYDLPLDFIEGERPTVLDLGANVGAFARWALCRWPGAAVDCYEPQGGPVLEALRANRVYGMDVYEMAIVPDDAREVAFAVRAHQPTGSHVVGAIEADAGEETIRVRAWDAHNLTTAAIVKIDVEGREPEILARYFAKERARTRGLIVEWHSEADRGALRELVTGEGFTVIDERPMRPDRPAIGVLRAVRPAA